MSVGFNRQCVAYAIATLGAVFLTGCPQFLDDKFQILTDVELSAGGTSASGGTGGASGAQAVGGRAGYPGATGGLGAGSSRDAGGSGNGGGVLDAGLTPDSGLPVDSGISEVAPCVGEFGTPQPLNVPGTSGALYGAWPYGSTLLFSDFDGAGEGIFTATRLAGLDYTSAALLPNIDTGDLEGGPSISLNGLQLFFFSDRSGGDGGGRDLWSASRLTGDGTFSNVTAIVNVGSSALEGTPRLSKSGLSLRFVSARNGSSDLWEATRLDTSADFGQVSEIAELNTGSREEGAAYRTDDLVVYFSSDRGQGNDMDVWRATRAAPNQVFSGLEQVDSVSSDDDDLDLALSRDALELYLTSDRGGSLSLWRASWMCN